MVQEGLVNKPLVKAWMWWALIWLTVFPLVGLLISIKFHHPQFLDGISWLTFGRLRPVHVNGVIFGSFSTAFLGILYYMVPKLCGIRMYREEWGWGLLWLWNIFLISGVISLLLGFNLGLEAAEFKWPFNMLRFFVLGLFTVQVLGTVYQRKEPRFYVTLWYTCAALVWTIMNLILGNGVLPYSDTITGVNNAAMHGLYIHYIVGLWLTPAGLAMIYYFLPLSTKNPLFAHKLSLLGFWSLALFYPFVGTHHYIFSPIPHWTQTISIVTSMLLIIPVWTVTVNFFGTVKGRWGVVLGGNGADNYSAKFLIMGAVYYLIGCFQGSVEALRRMQELTHFNDFVIAHSHLTVFGTMVVWAIGGLYYVLPRVTGRQLWSNRLASWHLWLTISGFSVMAMGLIGQGYVQGSMLEYGANFVDTVKEMKPWWISRTLVGATMDVGLLLMFLNFFMTSRKGKPFGEEKKDISSPGFPQTPPRAKRGWGWIESPSGVVLTAGFAFFFFAVLSQGIIPLSIPGTRVITVKDVITEKTVEVSDYTETERHGREVYIREGCWYCHSQYIRPVTGERFRWGPVSQIGEYAFDQPHLFGTRRIGPDLTRVGRRYGDDWHMAHHWNPRDVVPDSIMPRFPWLFENQKGNALPQLNEDGEALIAYVQKLGTSIGDWREVFAPTQITSVLASTPPPQTQPEMVKLGEEVYQRRCVGCHGEKGDGQGPAAKFLNPLPRDFTKGIFKFRSTPGQNSLPMDSDLFATITHGLWGTAMPPWYKISDRERWAVIQYIKTLSNRWKTEKPKSPISIPPEPSITQASLERGEALFVQCAVCHGQTGEGNGPLAGSLEDIWGQPVKPANFTLAAGKPGGVKLGHHSIHIFKTVSTGVGGTPMPAFQDKLSPEQIWDLVHFVQSLRVQAHEADLKAVGLKEEDLHEARSRIWASISETASRGNIDSEVVEKEG